MQAGPERAAFGEALFLGTGRPRRAARRLAASADMPCLRHHLSGTGTAVVREPRADRAAGQTCPQATACYLLWMTTYAQKYFFNFFSVLEGRLVDR